MPDAVGLVLSSVINPRLFIGLDAGWSNDGGTEQTHFGRDRCLHNSTALAAAAAKMEFRHHVGIPSLAFNAQ